jgi:hypothetical protein
MTVSTPSVSLVSVHVVTEELIMTVPTPSVFLVSVHVVTEQQTKHVSVTNIEDPV